jgi:hypothetical protein
MKASQRALVMGSLALAIGLVIDGPSARAQMGMPGSGRSLGGYGASTIGSYYAASSPVYVPYQGDMGGFIPYTGSGFGDPMNARPMPRAVPVTPIGGTMMPQTPIGGTMMFETPIGGGMLSGGAVARPRGGMGMGPGSRARSSMPASIGGQMGMSGGMLSMPSTRGGSPRAPSGPGLGYPFRMPPSLTGAGGMSMP